MASTIDYQEANQPKHMTIVNSTIVNTSTLFLQESTVLRPSRAINLHICNMCPWPTITMKSYWAIGGQEEKIAPEPRQTTRGGKDKVGDPTVKNGEEYTETTTAGGRAPSACH